MDPNQAVNKVKQALLSMQRFSWEQGVTAQAMLELGETDYVILMAKDAVVRQDELGRLGMLSDSNGVTDAAANGEPVLFAWKATGDPLFKLAADKMLDYLLHHAPKTEHGILNHTVDHRQVWVDSFYMAPPFLAAAGHPEEAVKQIDGFRSLLWLTDKQMYAHMWDDEKQAYVREDCWGVGNGWAAAGIVRVIKALPDSMELERNRLIGYLKEVLAGCLIYQRKDGLFHDVLDNTESFVETNTAQMLAYAIFNAINENWIDDSYLDAARRMRAAANTKVDEYGLVQGVCGAPTFSKAGTAPEGQAFFLLMESVAF
ncbi:glycosyl hydrolase [Paenibacillus psychroresistens]|uniref:Glycosyl hydrolase n=1 Tax=Paenibacillus psychroresistens TaxID=1778678 RepID=A0A6B8RIV4_9BACL|nr:glycoside hydrolase family 88 protein [Paenibacillus psychroresistens]QGQ96381.1 glycosyl hydrolase [Paenibacillus psychroresistens]